MIRRRKSATPAPEGPTEKALVEVDFSSDAPVRDIQPRRFRSVVERMRVRRYGNDRERVTTFLLRLLATVVFLYFGLLATARWTCIDIAALDNGFRPVFTALVGLVGGAVVSFYYRSGQGERDKEDKDDR